MNPPIDRGSGTAVPMQRRRHLPSGTQQDQFDSVNRPDDTRRASEALAAERPRWAGEAVLIGSGPLDGQLCGLFNVDIAEFNGPRRDDEIQSYVHKSLWEMMQAAFDGSGVPWDACTHEDRGDGILIVVPSALQVLSLVDPIPDRLRRGVRRHNRLSAEAARIQLRTAMHMGVIHQDDHGFVGRDVNLLDRLIGSRALKQMLSKSGAEVASITSEYIYKNLILRNPSLVDPALFRRLEVRVKETRTKGWAYIPGALTGNSVTP
jgi:hypothetical protein